MDLHPAQSDGLKRRLTDRASIAAAVAYLTAHGIAEDRIAVELSRIFYVDLDELNAVLAANARRRAAPAEPEPVRWHAVA